MMRRGSRARDVGLAIFVVLLGAVRPLRAQAGYQPACLQSASTQAELTECAGEDFKAVDARLQRLVGELRDSLPAPQQNQLDSSQVAWSAYAAVECRLQAAQYQDGTMYVTAVTLCRGSLATARIAALAPLLCHSAAPPEEPCAAARRYTHPAAP